MKRTVVLCLLANATVVHADPSTGWIGADAELVPVVNNHSSGLPGPGFDSAGPTAYALGAVAEWHANPWLSIGFAPRYVLGLAAANGASQSTSQLDLRVRFAAGTAVARNVRIYALAAPGYSTLFVPEAAGTMSTTPGSLGIELGGGATYTVSPRLAITAELGYQMIQGYSGLGVVGPGDQLSFRDDFLSFALGFVTPVL